MDKWVILKQNACHWCTEVQLLLTNKGISYEEYNISESPILRNLLRDMGLTTVPQVFHNGMRIGGYEDTKRYLEGGSNAH